MSLWIFPCSSSFRPELSWGNCCRNCEWCCLAGLSRVSQRKYLRAYFGKCKGKPQLTSHPSFVERLNCSRGLHFSAELHGFGCVWNESDSIALKLLDPAVAQCFFFKWHPYLNLLQLLSWRHPLASSHLKIRREELWRIQCLKFIGREQDCIPRTVSGSPIRWKPRLGDSLK